MTPDFLALVERVRRRGYRVYFPLFFGRANRRNSLAGDLALAGREWSCLKHDPRPAIEDWLRALISEKIRRDEPLGKLAIIGNCLSGGLPLALVDSGVEVAVLSQPACPSHFGPLNRGSSEELGLSKAEIENAREWSRTHEMFAFRFTRDDISPAARFHRLEREFSLAPASREIDSGPGTGFPESAHPVLTGAYSCRPGNPTERALDAVLDALDRRLKNGSR